jgi:acyl carrier protein
MSLLEILASIRPDVDFSSSRDYIEEGLLDSGDIINLVAELDLNFGISIASNDIIPDNFRNQDTISAVLQKNGVWRR